MVHMLLSMDNMHGILRQLYTDMMTLCEGMTSVASGIAGLGALLYISYRVWQSLARGEAIDLFPLLRPFALGICIMFFPHSYWDRSTESSRPWCRPRTRLWSARPSI
jgi:hypothetical protein